MLVSKISFSKLKNALGSLAKLKPFQSNVMSSFILFCIQSQRAESPFLFTIEAFAPFSRSSFAILIKMSVFLLFLISMIFRIVIINGVLPSES